MAHKQLQFRVKEAMQLSAFLSIHFKGKSRSDFKSMLVHRQIHVNGISVSHFDHPLRSDDTVTVITGRAEPKPKHSKVKIVFEDDYLIVIEKEEGLLSVAAVQGKEETTAFGLLSEYVKAKDPRNRLFIVHRIDRETSGLMMFVKTREIQTALRDNWKENIIERAYIAVLEGIPEKDEDTIVSYLHENKTWKVYSRPNDDGTGKEAVTHYRVIRKNDRYAMLKVTLDTGRKNQIRVHAHDMGHPIVGDIKYGAASSPIGRIGLHAQVLTFIHPITKETMRFETPPPKAFNRLF